MPGYSIWVLEYSHVFEAPLSSIVYFAHNSGTRFMPYGYILLRGNGHNVMVDVGFNNQAYGGELAKRFNVKDWQSPEVVLGGVGVHPDDIDTVLCTHAHFDHFGNTDAFPNATFYLQERELTKWVSALALPPEQQYVSVGMDPNDILRAVELAKAGRLKLLRGDVYDLLPGINVWAAHDTHTYGCMWIDVQAGPDPSSRFILAGDNVYAYDNVEGLDGDGVIRPPGLILDTEKCIMTIAQMLDLVDGQARQIVPVHESRVAEVFPSRKTSYGLNITEVHRAESTDSYV